MKQFEYKTFTKIVISPEEKEFKRWFNTQEEINFLNIEGAQGWELVSSIQQIINKEIIAMYYFKRQIVKSNKKEKKYVSVN